MSLLNVVLLAGLATGGLGGCPPGRCAESAPSGPLTWTTIGADAVEATSLEHAVRFGFALPPASAHVGPPRRIQLCFARPLDSAEVEIFGTGPRHLLTKFDERRVPGTAAAIELPPLTFDRVDVVVHHHLRPVPLPPRVRVGQEVRR
jgi:hypothetical protein